MADIFGHTRTGQPVTRTTLINGTLTASFLNYGGILQDLRQSSSDDRVYMAILYQG